MTKDSEVEAQYREQLKDIARIIDGAFNPPDKPKQHAFFLAVFPFGDEGRFNYMSNARREDIVVLLKEMVARFEGMPEARGRA